VDPNRAVAVLDAFTVLAVLTIVVVDPLDGRPAVLPVSREQVIDGGQARTSDESSQVRWVERQGLRDLDVHPSILRRIETALANRADPYFT
jgi:hypothetical protein